MVKISTILAASAAILAISTSGVTAAPVKNNVVDLSAREPSKEPPTWEPGTEPVEWEPGFEPHDPTWDKRADLETVESGMEPPSSWDPGFEPHDPTWDKRAEPETSESSNELSSWEPGYEPDDPNWD